MVTLSTDKSEIETEAETEAETDNFPDNLTNTSENPLRTQGKEAKTFAATTTTSPGTITAVSETIPLDAPESIKTTLKTGEMAAETDILSLFSDPYNPIRNLCQKQLVAAFLRTHILPGIVAPGSLQHGAAVRNTYGTKLAITERPIGSGNFYINQAKIIGVSILDRGIAYFLDDVVVEI